MENNSPYHVKKIQAINIMDKPMSYELMLSDLIPLLNYFVQKDYTTFEDFKNAKIIPENIYQQIIGKAIEVESPKGSGKRIWDVPLKTEDLYAIMGNVIEKTPLRSEK